MKYSLGMSCVGLLLSGCLGAELESDEGEQLLANTGSTESELAGPVIGDPGGGPIIPLGGCSSFPPTPCGEVQNNSVRTITISLNWTCSATTAPVNSSCAQSTEGLGRGGHRGGGNVDVDAFRVDTGCTYYGNINGSSFTRGPGWYKFTNLQTVTISSTSCSVGS